MRARDLWRSALFYLQTNYSKQFWVRNTQETVAEHLFIEYTVKPRYSAFQGTDQHYALNQGFHYCQQINNFENTSWDQNFYALLAELC